MAPIRIALVGLSTSATTCWAGTAHLPYLLSPRGRSQYQIVALLNSSKEAAETAKSEFKLPESVRTYGDPALLAADDEVDFVSTVTRVDIHYSTIEPCIRAGKAVYVEWPLTESLERSVALLGGEQQKGRDTGIIGLQGRVSPVVLKIKEVLASGRIGKVLSSEVRAFGPFSGGDRSGTVLEGVLESMFTERAIGGNNVTCSYAHMIDIVHHVLGEFKSFSSRLQIQRPDVQVITPEGTPVRTKRCDVPDLIAVHGQLAKEGELDIADDATLTVRFRSGVPFKDEVPLTWHINGEKGELRLSSPYGPYIQAVSVPTIEIEVHDIATNEVARVEWESGWKDWQTELSSLGARLVGELYDRYARWAEHGDAARPVPDDEDWPRLADALTRQEEIFKMLDDYDEAQAKASAI